MSDTADVIVIGGGCAGTSIAWNLARRGAGRIVLLEKDGIAAGASGRSSAIVRMHYTHESLARMALFARHIFEQFADVVGGDAGFRQVGFLALYGPRDTDELAANVAMQRSIGIDAHLLDAAAVRSLEPRMVVGDDVSAAWEPESGYADPVSTTNAFADAAVRLGVERRIGVNVTRLVVSAQRLVQVETSAGPIDTRTVVVAAGYRTCELIGPLGLELPITPVRHSIAIVQRTPDFGRVHSVIADRLTGSYYRPEGTALTLVGASPPYEGQVDPDVEADRKPTADDQAVLAGRFCHRFPSQADAGLRPGYTGVYDCTPDTQPVLGPAPGIEGLHLAAGFSGHGFKLSPAVGELVSQQILEGRTSLVDLDLFRLSRFVENRPITVPHPYSMATLG